MLPSYGNGTATSPTSPYTDPWPYRIDDGTAATNFSGTATTGTVTIGWDDFSSASNVIFVPAPTRGELREEMKAWHRALSQQAAWEASVALRSVRDDPCPRVPLQARKRPYVRQRAKKRVCAGSSRYRVLVN